MSLSDDRIARWARQLLVPGFGEEAQERLLGARVRVVGIDAVASAALVYLVQAGVGRLWLDDPEDVSPADLAGWLFPPSAVGTSRVDAARSALAPLSAFVQVDRYPTGGVPTAALVCAPSVVQAVTSAEAARRAGIPHVVVEPDGDGGAVVSVPPGAPCYSCARSTAGAGRPPEPGVAALAALGAAELIHLMAQPGSVTGRRVELVRGVATARPTARLAGCACAGAQPAEA
ncbi:ThiF family adenylyltransferase [Anaeromyxobacter sp. Red801]|uniref:ThiF family adenylyltransferase n=1 Tax=Anaeromyxobacter sp. Red801 TaxID=3411632 RepID=UPI003BA133A4